METERPPLCSYKPGAQEPIVHILVSLISKAGEDPFPNSDRQRGEGEKEKGVQ